MRIISWNINGYASLRRSTHWRNLLGLKADVMCFQEVKYRPAPLEEQFFTQNDYKPYWHAAERAGYSGVATFTRIRPERGVVSGIGDAEIDREGRVLRLDFPDLSVVNSYFPHSHRTLSRLPFKLMFLESFARYLQALEALGVPIVLCGDLNIAHRDIDLANPRENRKNAGCLSEEREFIDRLIRQGYVDAFRKFHHETGQYTWWSQRKDVRERNIGWRLDYFLVSGSLDGALKDCRHLPRQQGSDHCPVLLELETSKDARLDA